MVSSIFIGRQATSCPVCLNASPNQYGRHVKLPPQRATSGIFGKQVLSWFKLKNLCFSEETLSFTGNISSATRLEEKLLGVSETCRSSCLFSSVPWCWQLDTWSLWTPNLTQICSCSAGWRQHLRGVQHGHDGPPDRRAVREGERRALPRRQVHALRGQLHHPGGRPHRHDQVPHR